MIAIENAIEEWKSGGLRTGTMNVQWEVFKQFL